LNAGISVKHVNNLGWATPLETIGFGHGVGQRHG
jgi:hypothetical protein